MTGANQSVSSGKEDAVCEAECEAACEALREALKERLRVTFQRLHLWAGETRLHFHRDVILPQRFLPQILMVALDHQSEVDEEHCQIQTNARFILIALSNATVAVVVATMATLTYNNDVGDDSW